MSRSTISTFQLFALFPNEEAAMTTQKTWQEIEKSYGQDARRGDAVAEYTGEEFPALGGEYQTTEVLLYIAGSDADGWIITSQDVYEDGETTTDGGTNQAGETVYATADAAKLAAIKFAEPADAAR